MKNLFLLLFACFTLSMPVSAQTDDVNSDFEKVKNQLFITMDKFADY